MAEAPDPKMLGSWEEAFKYPVATVRGMERQLRSELNSNRERLRSLVGASYRDLLGTAESIIDMDAQMQDVEAYLGDMSSKCDARVLEKKGANMRNWDVRSGVADKDRYALASQLSVLRACPGVISRLLKGTTSLLLAARVLVISRLLHTKLAQRSSPPPYLESLRNRLASLRRKLLTRIDRTLMKPELSRESLVEAMCAFALATSSSPVDILRHYHHVRLEAIVESGQKSGDNEPNILQSLRIYVNTLRDTRAAVPANLSRGLERLKSAPILHNSDIYAIVDLNLDLHETNLGNDIRNFTPYIRLDDLHTSESEKLLKVWERQTFSSILSNLRGNINYIDDAYQVMILRNEIFELWFANQQHVVGMDSSEVVDGFRDVFNSHWSTIIRQKVASLDSVRSLVQATLQNWQGSRSGSRPSLWTPDMLSSDISHGARAFRGMLIATLQGRDESISSVADRYASWAKAIEAIEDTIQKISNKKWEDDLNVIDEEEDDILVNKQVLLSEDDPRTLNGELSESLRSGFSKLEIAMQEAAEDLDDEANGQKAVFLLRVWRDIRQHLPKSCQYRALGRSSITALQQSVAEAVSRAPLERGRKRLMKANGNGRTAGKALWEGDPPVPVLPSPWVFRLLRDLTSAMADIGTDVWSPQSINTLKEYLRLPLTSLLNGPLETSSGPNEHANERHHDEQEEHMNGEVDESSPESAQKTLRAAPSAPQTNGALVNGIGHKAPQSGLTQELKVQRLFDLLYLAKATGLRDKETEKDALASLQSSLEEDTELPPEAVRRLKKGAEEYWKRTSLLFALLA